MPTTVFKARTARPTENNVANQRRVKSAVIGYWHHKNGLTMR